MAPAASSDPIHGFQVAQRVRTVDAPAIRGTVRYVGSLPGRHGSWLGIEWDDSTRGRHDGALEGRQYFTCHVAGAGSFVREHKVDGGISLVDALRARYQQEGEKDMQIVSSGKLMKVTLVGVDKAQQRQSQLKILQSASLVNMGVSSVGPHGHLRTVAPEIVELILTSNLVSDWSILAQIKEELPRLQLLDLSSCRLRGSLTDSVTGLRNLILNDCSVKWEEMVAVGRSLPDLQELHLCRNGIASLHLGKSEIVKGLQLSEAFPNLRLLDLEENSLGKWEEILEVSQLPSLEELFLSDNQIDSIRLCPFDREKEFSSRSRFPFERLRSLRLGNNRLGDWASIDALNSFPLLQDLRISQNPLPEKAGGVPSLSQWAMLVARVATLTILNHSQVKDGERRRCEISYVHEVMEVMRGVKEEELLRLHPRFPYLREKYDIPMDIAPREAPKNGISGNAFMIVKLQFSGKGSSKGRQVTKKLPASTTLSKLKLLCERLFQVKSNQQVIFALGEEKTALPTLLDHDTETLGGFGLSPSPSIVVAKGDPATWSGASGPILNKWWKEILEQL